MGDGPSLFLSCLGVPGSPLGLSIWSCLKVSLGRGTSCVGWDLLVVLPLVGGVGGLCSRGGRGEGPWGSRVDEGDFSANVPAQEGPG